MYRFWISTKSYIEFVNHLQSSKEEYQEATTNELVPERALNYT